MYLYRIVSFESFVGLLVDKKERFVRPCKWEDSYESYLYEELNSLEGRKKLIDRLYTEICPGDYRATIRNFAKLWHAKWWIYAQCWSKVKDSDAMWRIYNYNKHSIQICTTDELIKNMIKDSAKDIKKPVAKSVYYDVDEETDIFKGQIKDIKRTNSTYEPYFHKRDAFEHEKEYRVLIDPNSYMIFENLSAMASIFEMSKNDANKGEIEKISEAIEKFLYQYKKEEVDDNYYVTIKDIEKYIIQIRVNPFAEDWFVDLVKSICKKNGIVFGGKSELYVRK